MKRRLTDEKLAAKEIPVLSDEVHDADDGLLVTTSNDVCLMLMTMSLFVHHQTVKIQWVPSQRQR
jgi:hypothetical protein